MPGRPRILLAASGRQHVLFELFRVDQLREALTSCRTSTEQGATVS